jgi:hypothetical protein
MEPDGKKNLVVANSPNRKESFSHAPASKLFKQNAIPAKTKLLLTRH